MVLVRLDRIDGCSPNVVVVVVLQGTSLLVRVLFRSGNMYFVSQKI